MWDLVVTKEADIEAGGTSANTHFLGWQLAKHLYMESPALHTTANGAETHLQTELQAGYLAVVTIPGHAVVADGMLREGGSTTFHIQYGWGGTNDGW